jgi:hypothetical protein
LAEDVIPLQNPIPLPIFLSLDIWFGEDGNIPLYYKDHYEKPRMPLCFVQIEI